MKFIFSVLKGAVMGIANIIPGVSGGTMAVSMGIYDDIISSITHLFKQFRKSVFTLLPYFIGMALSLAGLTYAITYALENYSLQTNFLFIGLILGGLPMMLGRLKGKKIGISAGVAFVLAFAAIIGLQLLGEGSGDVTLKVTAVEVIKLFVIGVIASATMVVPGVSGSMILMVLGYYNPILEQIKVFLGGLKAFDMDIMIHSAMILVPFGIGVLIGIFVIAKIIEFLLKNYEVITFSAILGLIVASPFAIFMQTTIPKLGFGNVSISIVTFIVGFVIALFLGKE